MADQTIASPPAAGTANVGTEECPYVADLINYALGRCLKDERKRVEDHLKKGECTTCRGWVEKASSLRELDDIDWDGVKFSLQGVRPAPPPTSDPTPIPSSSQWQRRVFKDLEKRLLGLDES